MAKEYRTLKLEILAETKQFLSDMNKSGKEVETFGDKAKNMGKAAAAAFAVAAAAAAAYAGKLAIEGVKAAIEDEAAQTRLANALKNVTDVTDQQIKSIEQQILQTSLATGVADDQLRPALQRLAVATGDVTKSQDLLKLALDISAATGKDVESVSNALAKAYEGNTGALSRLGVGISATEAKALGFEGVVKELAATFGGSATEQANTFEGQIQRLKVGFDEAKESVGSALLPILKQLLDYFTNNLIPKLIEAKEKAIDPIKRAFEDNRETLIDLWKFIKDYIVPIFEFTLVNAISNAGRAIAGIVSVVAKVFDGIRSVVDNAIDGINAFLRAYNAIPILPNVGLISKPAWVTGSSTGSLGNYQMSTGTTLGDSGSTFVQKMDERARLANLNNTPKITNPAYTMTVPSGSTSPFTSITGSTYDPSNVRTGENTGITINVNSPSIIDEEGFTRAVVLALNNSTNRGTTGAGDLRTNAQIL